MGKNLKKLTSFLLSVCLIPLLALGVSAEGEAQELFNGQQVKAACETAPLYAIFDGSTGWYYDYPRDTVITLSCEEGFGGLYLQFFREPEPYTLSDASTGKTVQCGDHEFLNEFLDLVTLFGYAPREVTLHFEGESTRVYELRMFSEGTTPPEVQRWKPAEEGKVDLMLFSTHSDDEHLFFAGILPYYGCEKDYQVMVVYLTGHYNQDKVRRQELLNGLWAVGIKNYPVIGKYGDFYSMDKELSYQLYAHSGATRENMTGYIVEQIRRYHPLVVVGHDLRGEYGHGAHQMYAEMLLDALELENDPAFFPESAQAYGLWETPKAYIHSYSMDQILMDWDVPLKKFDGMTAYEVSRDLGFAAHVSQLTDFSWYFKGHATAADIPECGPREFGLYRSLVGPDVEKNDFFENLLSHAQQEEAALAAATEPETLPEKPEEAVTVTIPESLPEAAEPTDTEISEARDAAPLISLVILIVAAFSACILFGLRKKLREFQK